MRLICSRLEVATQVIPICQISAHPAALPVSPSTASCKLGQFNRYLGSVVEDFQIVGAGGRRIGNDTEHAWTRDENQSRF